MRVLAVLLCALLALAAAEQLCLHGSVPLSLNDASVERAPWCTGEACEMHFALQFDTAHASDRRWPLNVTMADGTELSTEFPALAAASIQCSTSGEVIVTSDSAPTGERVRFIWTYSGVSSYSCAYVFSEIRLDQDFRAFEALLAYSGHISSFDAVYATQTGDYSLSALSESCVDRPVLAPNNTTDQCTVGDCRYGAADWRARPNDPTWAALGDQLTFCHLNCRTILYDKDQARYQAVHWREEAQALCAAHLNAAMYGCALPVEQVPALANSQAFLSNQLHCALNVDRSQVVKQVQEWNDGRLECDLQAEDAAGTDQTVQHSASQKKQNAYLIVMIVFIVLFVIAAALLVMMLCLFGAQLGYMLQRGSMDTSQVGTEMTGTGFFSSPVDDDPDAYTPEPSFAELTTPYYSQPSAPPPVFGAAAGGSYQ